ncbi:MAG: FAD-dependent monooxygenase [Bordetella sp.]|uniref:FAD-dependent monooxygenase n=1 Tax=Bordetella sp. TaxID=28081 RepID=UPI003F7BA41B
MQKRLRIGIIGGGIGGVALARSLDAVGIDYRLFEKASAFGEVGAGVQMTPNAVKVLKALGLGENLRRMGFLPEAMVGRNGQTGQELFRTPLKTTCPALFGAEFYHVHRADLHAALCQDIPADKAMLGAQCTGIAHEGAQAVANFSDGSRFEADLIVGADGIHSAVRDALWGKEPAHYTGHMCWRGLVQVDRHPLPFVSPDAAFWMGPKGHVVTYYVKGGAAVNIVAVSENSDWVEESWTVKSTQQELLNGFAGWHEDLIALFRRTDPEQIYKWGLFDRDPMARWSRDRVTLLGDAAHPMLPFLSQGAAMAIEDAYVLAQALAHFGADVPAALRAYEGERRPRTARVQLEARERGRTYHMSSPEDLKKRDQEYKAEQARNPNAVGIKAEWVYQYDATNCRERFERETQEN